MNFDLVHIFHRHGRLRRSQKHKPWHCGPGTSEGDVPNPENSQVCWQMLALRIFHPGNDLFWGERLKAFISAPSSHPARSWDHDGSCHFGACGDFNVKHPRTVDVWCFRNCWVSRIRIRRWLGSKVGKHGTAQKKCDEDRGWTQNNSYTTVVTWNIMKLTWGPQNSCDSWDDPASPLKWLSRMQQPWRRLTSALIAQSDVAADSQRNAWCWNRADSLFDWIEAIWANLGSVDSWHFMTQFI